MRILHVLPSLNQAYGGPLRSVLELSANAMRAGLSSEVLGFGPLCIADNPLPTNLLHSLPVEWPSAYCYSRELTPWLRSHLGAFDGVVLHGVWLYPNWAVARECWSQRKPYACIPHGMLDRRAVRDQGIWKRQKKILYWNWREHSVIARACGVFFASAREKLETMRVFPLPKAQFIVPPFGVNPRTQQQAGAVPENGDRKMALFLGRLHPKKNLEFLIDAWQRADLGDHWRLVIAGPGAPRYIARLRRLVVRLGLADRVHFTGFVSGEEKLKLLKRADWFLLPSKQENFGVAVLEAVSHGCPIAISDQVDIAEALGPDSEVLPLDPDAWVNFFRHRMTNPEHRAQAVRADRAMLLENFHIERVSAAWVETLRYLFAH